jgi:hypothetical protein
VKSSITFWRPVIHTPDPNARCQISQETLSFILVNDPRLPNFLGVDRLPPDQVTNGGRIELSLFSELFNGKKWFLHCPVLSRWRGITQVYHNSVINAKKPVSDVLNLHGNRQNLCKGYEAHLEAIPPFSCWREKIALKCQHPCQHHVRASSKRAMLAAMPALCAMKSTETVVCGSSSSCSRRRRNLDLRDRFTRQSIK